MRVRPSGLEPLGLWQPDSNDRHRRTRHDAAERPCAVGSIARRASALGHRCHGGLRRTRSVDRLPTGGKVKVESLELRIRRRRMSLHAVRRGGPAASSRAAVSSHLMEWPGAAMSRIADQRLDAGKRRKPAERPPRRGTSRARAICLARLGSELQPRTIGTPGRLPWLMVIQRLEHAEGCLAVQPLARSAWRSAVRARDDGLPSTVGDHAPGHQWRTRSKRQALVRPNAQRPRRARQPDGLRRPVTGRGRRDRCSMKASICAPSARCTGSWPRTSRCESGALSAVIPATPSPSGGHGPQPDLVLGYHPAPGAQTLDVLLPLGRAATSPALRRGLDGCTRENATLTATLDRGNLSHAGVEPRSCSGLAFRTAARRGQQRALAQLLARRLGHPHLSRPRRQRRLPILEGSGRDPDGDHPGFGLPPQTLPPPSPGLHHRSSRTRSSTAMPGSDAQPRNVHHQRWRNAEMCWLSADVPCKPASWRRKRLPPPQRRPRLPETSTPLPAKASEIKAGANAATSTDIEEAA